MNAVRMGGLTAAAANGAYASVVVSRYQVDYFSACFPLSKLVDGAREDRLVQGYGTFVGLIFVNLLAFAWGYVYYRRKRGRWLEEASTAWQHIFGSLEAINASAGARESDFAIVSALAVGNGQHAPGLMRGGCRTQVKARLEKLVELTVAYVANRQSSKPEGASSAQRYTAEQLRALPLPRLRQLAAEAGMHTAADDDSDGMTDVEGFRVFHLYLHERAVKDSKMEAQQVEAATLKICLEHPLLAAPFGLALLRVGESVH
jgi:hypothetical protein